MSGARSKEYAVLEEAKNNFSEAHELKHFFPNKSQQEADSKLLKASQAVLTEYQSERGPLAQATPDQKILFLIAVSEYNDACERATTTGCSPRQLIIYLEIELAKVLGLSKQAKDESTLSPNSTLLDQKDWDRLAKLLKEANPEKQAAAKFLHDVIIKLYKSQAMSVQLDAAVKFGKKGFYRATLYVSSSTTVTTSTTGVSKNPNDVSAQKRQLQRKSAVRMFPAVEKPDESDARLQKRERDRKTDEAVKAYLADDSDRGNDKDINKNRPKNTNGRGRSR